MSDEETQVRLAHIVAGKANRLSPYLDELDLVSMAWIIVKRLWNKFDGRGRREAFVVRYAIQHLRAEVLRNSDWRVDRLKANPEPAHTDKKPDSVDEVTHFYGRGLPETTVKVIRLAACGLNQTETAQRLSTDRETVRTHLRKVRRKVCA